MRSFLCAALLATALAVNAQGTVGRSALDITYDGVLAAEADLRRAEAALEKGREPLPGERLGLADGKSRLGPEYWARQKLLEDNVAAAKKAVADARRRWNERR